MGIEERAGKFDVFKQIVGKQVCQGTFPGDVPEFTIAPEKVDETYLLVKKMQRCYHDQPNYPTAAYFSRSFKAVEEAYLAQDLPGFQKAVRGLMIDIDSD